MFSSFERIILRLADGRASEIEDLTWNRTHSDVARALISRLIQ